MPKLKGQLDGMDYPKSIGKREHNLGDAVGSPTRMKGQLDNSGIHGRMPAVSKPKVALRGQKS